MNYRGNKYHECLRMPLTVDDKQSERIQTLVEHCKKYGFDNVMLMINAEEFHLGHITIEQAKPWVELFKEAKTALEAAGISVSINNWVEMGHIDRGRHLQPGQENFTLMVDMNGRQSSSVTCPLCENWRSYYEEYVRYIIKELHPDTYWIEDDFRLHNHLPLKGFGCYCEKHMAEYNKRLGTNYTREELVSRIFAKGECSRERRVWFDVNRDTMVDTANFLGRIIRSEDPATDVALMSSSPWDHCIEARDWNGIHEGLAQGGNKIDRIHLPYSSGLATAYMFEFNMSSMGVRALCPKDIVVMPEVENGSTSTYKRSKRFLRFMLESSHPLVLSGMTYSLYGFEGNGPRENMGFGEVVSDCHPYMQAVMDLKLDFDSLDGVIVPIDEKASYAATICDRGCADLAPAEYYAAAYISALGIAYKYSPAKEFRNKTVLVCGSNLASFSDEQIENLFADNYVIVEASAVIELQRRGLLRLINACAVQIREPDAGYHTYEECADSTLLIEGIRGMRSSCRNEYGRFAEVTYCKDIHIRANVFNHRMEKLAPSIVEGARFFVLPYFLGASSEAQTFDLRRHFLCDAVLNSNSGACVISGHAGVYSYLFNESERSVLMLTNATLDTFDSVDVRISGVEFEQIYEVTRTGETLERSFSKNGNFVSIDRTIDYLEALTFILK